MTKTRDGHAKTGVEITVIQGGKLTVLESISLDKPDQILGETAGIRDMSRIQYPPANRCIYCGAKEDLTREHIIPYGLNGTSVIQAASCPQCAKRTSDFEKTVLRGPMRSIRVLHGFQSRSKHEGAPETCPVRVIRHGVENEIELPLEEAPVMLYFPEFPPPRIVTGKRGTGIDMTGVAALCFGPTPDDIARRLEAESVTVESPPYEPVAFARMLAKIGFATAYAEGILARVGQSCPVIPAILGEEDGIGTWVGTMTGAYRKYPELLHRVALHEDRERSLLIAEVQLWASSGTPSYGVVLGTLRPDQ
jgi:hypothetical protein